MFPDCLYPSKKAPNERFLCYISEAENCVYFYMFPNALKKKKIIKIIDATHSVNFQLNLSDSIE